jgi:hypothetical protein
VVTGSVRVKLTADDTRDRYPLAVLERCPDGAVVRVDIGKREWASIDAAVRLHEHADRLLIEFVGTSPEGVQEFVNAARVGVGWVAP